MKTCYRCIRPYKGRSLLCARCHDALAARVGLPDDHPLFYERYAALAQTTMDYVLRGVPTDWILTDLRSGGER